MASANAVSKLAAQPSQKTRMGLVVLWGGKDMYLKLVHPEVLDWICLPYDPPKNNKDFGSYEERVPKSIRAQYRKATGQTTCRVSFGSYDNDRAQGAPGETFYTVTEVMAHVQKHNMHIVDEYHGNIY